MGTLEDLLMCSVCIERYHEKDRQPVLLPRCGHSFCRTCVSVLVSSGCIVCPTCRTDQRIECVDRLPTEYTLLAIINAQENYKKETCEYHQVKLSFWCRTCDRAACGECLFEDHPTHKHDILRSAKYISDMKQNASDITTRFFNCLTKKEESLYKLILDCTSSISYAFKSINILRMDTEEARELMKSIKQEATITSATTLHETAKFLGLKWNIQDANTILNRTGNNTETSLVDPEDEISIEKAKIKEKALAEKSLLHEARIKKEKIADESKKIRKSKTTSAVDNMHQFERRHLEVSGKSKRKPSKVDDGVELEQLEKALEESLRDQEALAEEIKNDEGKITGRETSNKKDKNNKKVSRKKSSNITLDDKGKLDEKLDTIQDKKEDKDITLISSNLVKDIESSTIEDETDANAATDSYKVSQVSDTKKPVEINPDIVEKKENNIQLNHTGIINGDSGLSEESKPGNYMPSNAVNQANAKLSDCIQVPGFMICVEGQNGRLGQITWGPQGLHVHVLQFQQIDYDIVITTALFNLLTPTTSPVIFLELRAEKVLLGRVYIKLWGNLRRARNFLSLCLGDEGDSYVNTKFLQVYNVGSPGERVLGGDYEYNTGKGGRGVWDDLEWNGDYTMPMKAGLITAAGSGQSANNSLFLVCTESDPSRNFSCPFGKVYEGLQVVKEAVKLTAIKQVYISDCGVLIVPPGMISPKNT